MIGARDDQLAARIERINATQGAYDRQEHSDAERLMLAALGKAGSASERQHLLNELADLYSYHLLDIERAVDTDTRIQAIGTLSDGDRPGFSAGSANNRILADTAYRDRYVNVTSSQIMALSQRRLERNRNLLMGTPPGSSQSYTRAKLEQFLADVGADLTRTHPGTPDRRQLISRLIRAEWELINLGTPPASLTGATLAKKEGMRPSDFFFQEIDFISLSRYYESLFDKTGTIEFAEMALAIVYIPYNNMTDYSSRWMYNRLVNRYIEKLIDACYRARRHQDMLYYISLNKSRMILEERARYRSLSPRLAGIGAGAVPLDPVTRLPDKQAFLARLRSTPAFLDYYIAGDYRSAPANSEIAIASRRDSASSLMELRAVAVAAPSAPSASTSATAAPARPAVANDVFVEESLYVTYLDGGAIQVQRLTGAPMRALRTAVADEIAGLEAEYGSWVTANRAVAVASGSSASPTPAPAATPAAAPAAAPRRPQTGAAARLLLPFTVKPGVVVSPDKWLSAYPFALALGPDSPRALNLMSFAPQSRLSNTRLAGLFNPTGDLPDSEQEIAHIARSFPDSTLLKRGEASKRAFAAVSGHSILHLSMHGLYDPGDPSSSKLLLAGSRMDESRDDSAALYAREMLDFAAAQGNELVFLAACETGLTAGDSRNRSELMGILRPLMVGGNRNIVLTLWKVDSLTAGKFVQYFYEALAQSNDVRVAFSRSQDRLRAEYPTTPYIWAPYYLIQ
ncbi:CHAT domain-containing protein [Azospirillum sp. RWY-5-1]|uniref:CHAT domain-containing protein n=1 Tax=Azospirillum oleiclasticum TaxID=2735135 RepID=A0ABX2TAY3_9PROT|nr:CHAT domain-containing protein [Azospirillum oleiclasticum]NYZ21339.1 CHAT domain-containing protein [Azospirillum oleiclasticum]